MNTFLIITSAFMLTLFHTLLPEHWMPFVLVGKAQKWNAKKTLLVAAAAATGHVLITLLLGFVVVFITSNILNYIENFSKLFTSAILIIIGLIYLAFSFRNGHAHSHAPILSDKATITSLITLFSFSPCEAVIPLFILVNEIGWFAFGALSLTILAATILGMFSLILLTLYGYRKLNFHWLEDNEKTVIGIVLILLGIIAFVV